MENKIRFIEDAWLEFVTGYDEMEEPIYGEEHISAGTEFEVDILENEPETEFLMVQFPRGEVSCINKKVIETV